MAFYDDMAAMVSDLLAPDTSGGLGQGAITLTRLTPGTPNPTTPWEPVTPTKQTETLRGAVSGVSAELVGAGEGSAVILASDRAAICAVPSIGYQAGDVLAIDGVAVHVLLVQNIPAAGTPAAVRFVVRNG